MPHKINLVDKDGNQSEVTLPDYALDSTQQLLLKSMQALVKTNPKAQKAYEDLIGATKKVVTATEEAADQQEKDAKALQNAVQTAADKQVSALKQFRTSFSDRVGRDMRDTFTAGGNILTAAIKTATVGLAAGAGLLYKTFMDTSDAFRQLAQSGLGGAGGSGREAQDAVGNLTRLGMSANEAASMLIC
jgi:alanyl-tRNA synthetase